MIPLSLCNEYALSKTNGLEITLHETKASQAALLVKKLSLTSILKRKKKTHIISYPYSRIINCLTPDIHNAISLVCDPLVKRST